MGQICFSKGDNVKRNSSNFNTTIVSEQKVEPYPRGNTITEDLLKFLLLGAGESGKSTLFKQMTINYMESYTEHGFKNEKGTIIRSFFGAFIDFLKAIEMKYKKITDSPKLSNSLQELFSAHSHLQLSKMKFTPRLVEVIKEVWNSDYGVFVWENRAEFQVTDSLEYFVKSVDRLGAEDYIPTETDFLLCRLRTIGIAEQTFLYKKVKLFVVDLGGQRSERKKWIQCFDGVTAVLFVVSMSGFNQTLFEEGTVKRLTEAKELLFKTMKFLPFRETPFILFLNKEDILKEKLNKLEEQGADLEAYFPGIKLDNNKASVLNTVKEYLKNEFLNYITPEQRSRIIPHYITATDKDTFIKVFDSATKIVLDKALIDHFPTEAEV